MKPHRILLHGQQGLKQAAAGDRGGGPPAPSAGREQELQPAVTLCYTPGPNHQRPAPAHTLRHLRWQLRTR